MYNARENYTSRESYKENAKVQINVSSGQLPPWHIDLQWGKLNTILAQKYCCLITKFLAQKARLARIQIAKATSGAAFVAKKRAAEARLAAQVNIQKKMSRPAQN